jgi:hypothetical protein
MTKYTKEYGKNNSVLIQNMILLMIVICFETFLSGSEQSDCSDDDNVNTGSDTDKGRG